MINCKYVARTRIKSYARSRKKFLGLTESHSLVQRVKSGRGVPREHYVALSNDGTRVPVTYVRLGIPGD